MGECRADIIAWVGSNIIPHESDLRVWLRRMSVTDQEINDIVQDAYLSIARLDGVSHIHNPRAYFFQSAKTAVLMRLRRERIVRIEQISELELLRTADTDPGPERSVSARLELERIRRLIAALPERCRTIFELRRIQGLPQREIAQRLGISEHVVEAQAVRGLKLILEALADDTVAGGRIDTAVRGAARGNTQLG